MHTINNWKWITILLPFLWTFTNCESILPLHHNCGGTFSLKEETVILEFKSSDVTKIVRYCSLILNIPSGYEVLGKFHKINLNSDSKVNRNFIGLLCITKNILMLFRIVSITFNSTVKDTAKKITILRNSISKEPQYNLEFGFQITLFSHI